jgi:hypothetical protein
VYLFFITKKEAGMNVQQTTKEILENIAALSLPKSILGKPNALCASKVKHNT